MWAYVMPFYDSKQYADIAFKHGDTVHASGFSDYIVLDSCETSYVDLDHFFKNFPNPIIRWRNLKGGYVYGIYPESS